MVRSRYGECSGWGWAVLIKVLQRARIYFEQVEYPEQTRDERFLYGLRRGWWPFWVRDRYHYLVMIQKGRIQTYWGVEQSRWWGGVGGRGGAKAVSGSDLCGLPIGTRSL